MHLAVWRARRTEGTLPGLSIALAEGAPQVDRTAGTATLHYRLEAGGPARLEALRETRRAMIREEWTLGLEPGEPSLAEAIFSAQGVQWEIPIGEQNRCRETLQTLVARANRRLEDAAARF
jgi:hypothetical protein